MSGKLSLYELVDDLVLYRNLDPLDPRLPRFAEAWAEIGLPDPVRPRKHEASYAQTTAWFLRRARCLDKPEIQLAELVYLGDTAMADGQAFRNLRTVGGWRGWAFIGAEKDEEMDITEKDGVFVANRWGALAEFASLLHDQGAHLDDRTAVVIDIDKTALGARGRNDKSIDRARVLAIEATAADAIGAAFNRDAFRRAYHAVNVPKYHPFTADNQDYVAYICLMVSAGFTSIETLLSEVDTGRIGSFQAFIRQVEAGRESLPTAGLRSVHADIYARVQAGDPTPFKTFRQREYLETVTHMGHLSDNASLAERLLEEVCLTREVVDFARWLRGRGCLLLALSDKPDEATMPAPGLASQGYLPLHRTPTHVAGPSIAELLPG